MWAGILQGIYICQSAGMPMQAISQVFALEDQGLEHDRYSVQAGTFSKNVAKKRHITLIETETLWALQRDYGLELFPEETRRNFITQGVPLNHLVGKTFFVGPVKLQGTELCEPCGYLERLAQKPIKDALKHRGGMRALVRSTGMIRQGDAIRPASSIGQ